MNNSSTCDCKNVRSEIVSKVKKEMLCDGDLCRMTNLFKTMGDYTRTKILWALDKQELCVCDLSALLDMTQSAISHQLRMLKEENLVTLRKDGKNAFYTLSDEHVRIMLEIAKEHIDEK